MTKLIRSFTGMANGVHYDYELTQSENEYKLTSYLAGEPMDSLTWDLSTSLDLLNKACDELQARDRACA